MGRTKISIAPLTSERARKSTFTKRKRGLMKKAMELSILCSCEVAVLVFGPQNKLYQYSSAPVDTLLYQAPAYDRPHKPYSNADYVLFNPSYVPTEADKAKAAAAAAGPAGQRQAGAAAGPSDQAGDADRQRQQALQLLQDPANVGLAMDAAAALDRFSRSATVAQQRPEMAEMGDIGDVGGLLPIDSEAEAANPRKRQRRGDGAYGDEQEPRFAAGEEGFDGLKISIPRGRVHADVLPIPLGAAPSSPRGRVTRSSSRASARPGGPPAGTTSPQPPSAGGLFPSSMLGSGMLRSPRDVFGFQFSPLYANSPRGGPSFNLQTPGSRGLSPRTAELYMRQFAESGVLSPMAAPSAAAAAAPSASASSTADATAPAEADGEAAKKPPSKPRSRAGSKRKR